MSNLDFPALLGPLAELQNDPDIIEIMVDAPDRIYFERSDNKGQFITAEVHFESVAELQQVITAALAIGSVTLSPEQPIGEVRLPDGSRLVAVMPPTAVDSPYMIISKPDNFAFSWELLIQYGTLTSPAHELLMKALQYGVNVLVAGHQGSGKDTTINLLAESLPHEKRVVVLASPIELPLKNHPRRIHLESGGPANLSRSQLLETALKLRLDWLVTGEIQGSETLPLLQWMRAGYHTLTTMYAASPEDALARLEAMCLMYHPSLSLPDIQSMISSAIGLIVYQQNHMLPDYRIKLTHFIEVQGLVNGRYLLQPLFTYNPETGLLEATPAAATWATRQRQRLIEVR